jgi:hypothetical protein
MPLPDRLNYYRGVAKVDLRHLSFERLIPGVRTIRQSHVKALVNTFESEGCLRHNPDNFVKVLIKDEILQQVLQRQNLSQNDLLGSEEPCFLEFPEDIKLTVIQGKHRLLAAEQQPLDRWWIAHLYSDGKNIGERYYSLLTRLQICLRVLYK